MKKSLLFLFMLTLFVGFSSCSSDDEEDNGTTPPEYYNPIEGEWIKEKQTDYKIIFTKEFLWKEEWYEAEKWGHTNTKGTYTIDKSSFKFKGVTYNYTITGDKLTISLSGESEVYIKSK